MSLNQSQQLSTSISCLSCSSHGSDRECHLKAAGIVKNVHAQLRKKYRKGEGDIDAIWESHCRDRDVLDEYASAMHHLAVDHWSKNPETRIDWCYNLCLEYFLHGGLEKVLNKEERRKKYKLRCERPMACHTDEPVNGNHESVNGHTNVCDGGAVIDSLPEGHDTSGECISIDEDKDAVPIIHVQEGTKQPVTDTKPDIADTPHQQNSNNNHCENPAEKHKVNDVSCHEGSPGADRTCNNSTPDQASPPVCRVIPESPNLSSDEGLVKSESEDVTSEELESQRQQLLRRFKKPAYNVLLPPFWGKIRLLDVGSCYNPFLAFPEFLALGIDISPAVETVYHCDFLHVETSEPLELASDTMETLLHQLRSPVEKLPGECFHVVVFSLLLEYFPCTYQRWLCCQKAHDLLMVNGLLLIITPDSHHQNRNAPMMKSWRCAIESMGFKRWRYVKLEHLHCMAFRKVQLPEETSMLISDAGPDMLYIPQDFNNILDECNNTHQFNEEDELLLSENFSQLPLSWD